MTSKILNTKNLGQVFTPSKIVKFMIGLIKNGNSILEPSAGCGNFVTELKKRGFKNITAIEIDPKIAKKEFIVTDFFNYPLKKFSTIIGNPPYVKYNQIPKSTMEIIKNSRIDYSLFNNLTNLYQYFIYKSILHLEKNGELIFITPRDFLKATSSKNLNKFIYENGTITDFFDLGESIIFEKHYPNIAIWRFEKDNFSRKTKVYDSLGNKYTLKNFVIHNNRLYFLTKEYPIKFNELFFVKIGAASGYQKAFEHEDGIDFVCSFTAKTKKTKKMIYNEYHPHLEKYKNILINRKIRPFNEKNWWMWGRKYYHTDLPRIYVNYKTRNKNPFFLHDCKAYDGTILAIFPKIKTTKSTLEKMKDYLNMTDWKELGFYTNGKFYFSQKSLESTLLPDIFIEFFEEKN